MRSLVRCAAVLSASALVLLSFSVGADEPAKKPADQKEKQPPPATKKTRRNPWIWVSALFALAAAGLLIWALSARSDLDSTQTELDSTQQELASTKQELDTSKQQLDSTDEKLDSTTKELDTTTQELESSQSEEGKKAGPAVFAAGTLGIVKTLYDDLSSQLGATQEDLDATEKELEDANQKAGAAEQDAAAAKEKAAQADNKTAFSTGSA